MMPTARTSTDMDGERLPLTRKSSKRSRTTCDVEDASNRIKRTMGSSAECCRQSDDGYQTFQAANKPHYTRNPTSCSERKRNPVFSLFPRCLFAVICMRQPSANLPSEDEVKIQRGHEFAVTISRRMVIFLPIVIGLLACLNKRSYNIIPGIPEWQWDHNVYITRNSDAQRSDHKRIALLAQVVSSRSLKVLSEISSRPNRAYARQWGLDYAQYSSGRASHDPKACFDKIFVLKSILEKQNLEANESSLLWSHPEKVRYDSMILLPPDSIVTNLDTNLFEAMLPADRLVAIAGFTETKKLNSVSGIIIFNLRHKYADAVAKLWWEMTSPPDVSCGANNDLGMLLSAIGSVMDPSEDIVDLIQSIGESSDGFVGRHMIKCIPPTVPGPRLELLMEKIEASRTNLQETADAVCYRYYPRCEVIVT